MISILQNKKTVQLLQRLFAGIAALAMLSACAGLLPKMTHQGRLLNSSGQPVPDGNYTVTYSLFTTSTGGAALHSETKSVAVRNGLFSSDIGVTKAITPEIFAQPLFLEMVVNGETLTPRQELMGSPYAMSLASGAVVQGIQPVTRTLLGVANTGASLLVANLDNSATGGHGLVVLNRASPPNDTEAQKVAALEVKADRQSGTTRTAYAATFISDGFRGIYVKGGNIGGPTFFDAIFDGPVGIQVAGNCVGCVLAYTVRNVGSSLIHSGDMLAAAGVEFDQELGQPIMLVRKAEAGDDAALIGVAKNMMSREPVQVENGRRMGGFSERAGKTAANGEYLSVVVHGLAQVKVSSKNSSKIAIGDRLTIGDGGSTRVIGNENSIARAMSAIDSDGLVWAMVNAR
jgi:hypothetical protein